MPVKFNNTHIGALCVVFQEDFVPGPEDLRFMEIIASAVAVEEDRRQTQLTLEESNKRYKHICETVTDYIYTVHIKDGQPIETIHGPSCIAITGYTAEEFAADPNLWIKMVPEEDRLAVLRHAALILSGEKVPPLEHRIIKKDGTVRWVRNTTVLHFNEQGKLLSYDGLIQDISDRKKAEEEIKESEERFRTLFDSATDGILVADAETKKFRMAKVILMV
jgi:PAS domain S-box-containing protein